MHTKLVAYKMITPDSKPRICTTPSSVARGDRCQVCLRMRVELAGCSSVSLCQAQSCQLLEPTLWGSCAMPIGSL